MRRYTQSSHKVRTNVGTRGISRHTKDLGYTHVAITQAPNISGNHNRTIGHVV